MATLHRLLWGAGDGVDHYTTWPIRPWETPAVGLPVRVASRLLASAMKAPTPKEWSPENGPLVWRIPDPTSVLADGRRRQFGCGDADEWSYGGDTRVLASQVGVEKTPKWEVLPHAAYLMPFCVDDDRSAICSKGYALYCDTLLLLTALDGREAVLDGIIRNGNGILPFRDRWDMRSRIHLPGEAWEHIEGIIRWTACPAQDSAKYGRLLLEALASCTASSIVPEEFAVERIDVRLDPGDEEIVRAIRPFGSDGIELPTKLRTSASTLADDLCVRIGQLNEWVEQSHVLDRFPRWETRATHKNMEDVATVFYSPSDADAKGADQAGRSPSLVVFPEVSIPQPEVRTLRDLVGKTGRASLAGLYWRVLRPVYRRSGRGMATRRWVVNEAELAIPVGHGQRGPTLVRWYRVRKLVPAHIEHGMADALSRQATCQSWQMLAGRKLYRFVHQKWGDFTVAICADLLDGTPWRSFRGEVLHLFMVAFNRDVELYESLTWARAYENYTNLVGVNHGKIGGSFLWTPQRGRDRELARFRGASLFLSADVKLPVRELLKEQEDGVRNAVEREACGWIAPAKRSRKYKSPPPGYWRKALK